jgi:hypothetical protein
LDQLTFAQRRQLVELLIDHVIVTHDQVEIRSVVPTGPKGETTPFCHLRLDYLDGKAQPILLKGSRLGGFITYHQPVVLAALGPTQGQMDRAIPLLGQVHMMPEERLTNTSGDPTHLAAALAMAIPPKTPVDPNTPMPPQPRQMCHQMRICEPTIRSQDDGTLDRKQLSHLIQPLFVHRIRDTTAGVFQHGPPERDCPATIYTRDAHQTVGIPPHRGVQGQR